MQMKKPTKDIEMVINMSGRAKRLGRVTRQEANWLDALERSELDTTSPFTGTEAARMVAITPNKKGHIMKMIPIPRKMTRLLIKSPNYVRWNYSKHKHTTVYWVRLDD